MSSAKAIFDPPYNKQVTRSKRILNTPSEFARECLLYIQEVGILTSLQPHTSQRENLDSYLFCIVRNGNGTFTYDNQVLILNKGDCIFIDCHKKYSHTSSESEPWELMWVHFNGKMMPHYYQYYKEIVPNIKFYPYMENRFIEIVQAIMDESQHDRHSYEIIVSKLLTDLLTLCFLLPKENQESESIQEKLHQIQIYINENFHSKLSLDVLATNFYISKYHMCREFKNFFGITIGDYLLNKRITHGKELLRFSNKSIGEIAKLCGFSDGNYFNKVFKEAEGMTPSEFRKKW